MVQRFFFLKLSTCYQDKNLTQENFREKLIFARKSCLFELTNPEQAETNPILLFFVRLESAGPAKYTGVQNFWATLVKLTIYQSQK